MELGISNRLLMNIDINIDVVNVYYVLVLKYIKIIKNKKHAYKRFCSFPNFLLEKCREKL